MKTKQILFGLAVWLSLIGTARAGELVFSQTSDNQSTYGPSQLFPDNGVNSEIADDFVVTGSIDRVEAGGFTWGSIDFRGVYIRFYEFRVDNSPGALQQEYFLAAGDPNLGFDSVGNIRATLSPAFSATGRHFISVQPVSNYWYWWSSKVGAPRGQAFYFRNLAGGETVWQHGDYLNINTNADVTFSLYGSVTGPGVIDSLSSNTLARSGFLEILGNNFGGDGTMLIGGLSAPVSSWSSTRIIAYVPESAPLTTLNVQVVNAAGASNTMPLTVTLRVPASGRVNWRFRMDGPYSMVRPAIATDNTIYTIDAFNHLYALTPDGALKWLVAGAGDKGVAVGLDGTIYVASESFIKAFHPDGSAKWTFVQNPRALICLGVAVGPDGNIYSVATEGLGVFSLTPAGELRWAVPEGYVRPPVEYGEIVFGPNGSDQQLYFGANTHTRALRLDGTPVFTLAGNSQPAIGPDGSVHVPLGAYSPGGSLVWSFLSPYPYNTFSPADVGADGTHYLTQNLIRLFALNPGGSVRWQVTLTNYAGGPIVDSSNSVLVMGGSNTLDHPGTIQAVSATTGKELWLVTLPPEDPTIFNPNTGTYGYNQGVNTRGRFSNGGTTVYYLTSTATGDNNTSRSFVYSVNVNGTSSTPPPTAALLRSANITLSAKLQKNVQVNVSGVVTVKDQNGAGVSSATVTVSWRLPDGTTQTQTVNTSNTGDAKLNTSGGRGTYTLTVTNIAKSGGTFDNANSMMSRSITK